MLLIGELHLKCLITYVQSYDRGMMEVSKYSETCFIDWVSWFLLEWQNFSDILTEMSCSQRFPDLE